MAGDQRWQAIPTQLEIAEFEQFVLPHLSPGSRGPAPKLGLHKIFNNILSIPSSGQNPKILGRDDTEVIRYLITIGIPFSGHLLAQKGQYCGFEIAERRMTSIVGDVLVHQAP